MALGPDTALARLVADGMIERDGGGYRTCRRWQGQMARAAADLARAGEELTDLRVPIAHAVVARYGARLDEAELAVLVEALLPIEAAALARVIALEPTLP